MRTLTLLLVLASSVALAEEPADARPSAQTLFDSDLKLGFWLEPSAKFGSMGDVGTLFGGRLALQFGPHVSLGVEGYQWEYWRAASSYSQYARSRLWYGGLFGQMVWSPSSLIHPGASLSIAYAELSNAVAGGVNHLQVEPQLHAELNLTKWLRVTLGLGFRIPIGTKIDESGLTLGLGLKGGLLRVD